MREWENGRMSKDTVEITKNVVSKKRIADFKQLRIWQLGMNIVMDVYRFTDLLPQKEQFGLISQMRRSAISLPANISEGFRRRHNKEYRQFLHISLGSSAELETYVDICRGLYSVDEKLADTILSKLDQFQRMTNTLIGKLS